MDPLSVLAAGAALVGTILGSLVAVLNIREKLWPAPKGPHALEAALRDVAQAIREQGAEA